MTVIVLTQVKVFSTVITNKVIISKQRTMLFRNMTYQTTFCLKAFLTVPTVITSKMKTMLVLSMTYQTTYYLKAFITVTTVI